MMHPVVLMTRFNMVRLLLLVLARLCCWPEKNQTTFRNASAAGKVVGTAAKPLSASLNLGSVWNFSG